MPQFVDSLIHAHWIIPVEPAGVILENHALAIHKGRIAGILPAAEATREFEPDITHRLDDHALIPGLINTHTHAAMSLLRGLADDLPLMTWLQDHIWPAEAKWVSEEFVRDGTQLAIAEMLRGGVTCMNDMYFFPDVAGQTCAAAGFRATIGLIVIDFPTIWANDAQDYISKGLAVHDEFRDAKLIRTAFAPHAPYTVSDAPFEKILAFSEELDIPIHIHLHETAHEVAEAEKLTGKRPLARIDELGLLSPHLLAVHMTQLQEQEIARIAEAGAHVLHCPESNLKLASGMCRVQDMLEAGINVALGTDGAASNNDLDMFGEMRTAALISKVMSGNAASLPAETALALATINGARALGIDEETGSLKVGKAADITAVNLGDLESQPIYHPTSQLVYATGRDKVSDVWIAGRHVLKDRALTTLDEQEILANTALWGERIRSTNSG